MNKITINGEEKNIEVTAILPLLYKKLFNRDPYIQQERFNLDNGGTIDGDTQTCNDWVLQIAFCAMKLAEVKARTKTSAEALQDFMKTDIVEYYLFLDSQAPRECTQGANLDAILDEWRQATRATGKSKNLEGPQSEN